MADYYSKLTDAEKAYWDIYTRLRELSDWPAFTDGQKSRKDGSRNWLVSQRKQIWRSAQPKSEGGDGKGWDVNNRRQRYEQLRDESLNGGSCRRVSSLPTNGCTDTEKVQIKERCMWWQVSSVDDTTKSWRNSNSSWLTERRKKVWHLGEDEGWNTSNRKVRYDNLCIATKTGSAYNNWLKTHDAVTGKTKPDPAKPSTKSKRQQCVDNARSYLGVSENPPSSNRGSPQPSGWQKRVYGSDGVPWCACFTTCMCWDVGVEGSSSAAVTYIMSMAQNKQGMFRGWTTDPSNVLAGDMAIIGCSTCHVGLCASSDDACHTIEGNTSPGTEGSQYNGGCVAEKHRSRGEIIGWALVDFPD
jgi:hypothetical protein